MKRKILATFLSLCLLVGLLPTVALAAEEGTKENPWNISADGDENNVTAYLERNNADEENPTYTLTISGAGAMANYWIGTPYVAPPWNIVMKKITSVVVGEGVTNVGAKALKNATFLTDVALPSTIKVIEEGCFDGCTSLVSINFPVSIEKIGIQAFYRCSALTGGINLPNVKIIGNYAFRQTKINSVLFGNYLTKIDYLAFADCKKLTSMVIPDSVEMLGARVFQGCTNLTTITLPKNETFTKIGCETFKGCTSLRAIEIPASVTTIGYSAFEGCTSLTKVVLPSSVTKIEHSAFQGTSSMVAAVIPASVTDIPKLPNEILSGMAQNSAIYLWSADQVDLMLKVEGLTESSENGFTRANTALAVTNGGTFAEDTKFEAGELAEPTRTGYTFQGWYAEESFAETSKVGADTPITPGTTYYAKWTLNAPTNVTVTTDKSYISSEETATLTATAEHSLDGVSYEYQWYTGTPEDGSEISGATNKTYTVSDLSTATSYYCKVTAANGDDRSATVTSSAVTITPASSAGSVAITNSTTSATYGDGPFTFTYTASGTAAVASSDISVATVSDDSSTVTVTIVGTGETTISVNFEGNTGYSSASDSFTLTVNKAALTITAENESIYVGDSLPTYSYTVSGWQGEDADSAAALLTGVSVTCPTANRNSAGNYPIVVSGPESIDNYIISYVNGTLTVSNRSGSSSSGSSNVSGSGDAVSISASGGTVTASQMESAVNKADEGAAITIKATSSTTVSLPVGGMADAADNDNDVLLDLRYGEVTLTARTIAGLTDGVSSSGKIKVSITSQTSSKDETISDLLDKGAAVFDVSVTINDVEVHSFDGTLTLTFTVSNLSKITDPHILHILTDGTKEYYAPDSISGNTITVKGVRNLSTFAVIPGSEVPEEQTNPFTDVYESDYYYDAVQWAVANGVTTGTSATTFSPDAPVTRAQAVTFQWRAAGSLVVSGSSFDDVAADAYYVNAVTWAVANGITNGTGGNNFSPDAAVSRAQAVTFLYREQE